MSCNSTIEEPSKRRSKVPIFLTDSRTDNFIEKLEDILGDEIFFERVKKIRFLLASCFTSDGIFLQGLEGGGVGSARSNVRKISLLLKINFSRHGFTEQPWSMHSMRSPSSNLIILMLGWDEPVVRLLCLMHCTSENEAMLALTFRPHTDDVTEREEIGSGAQRSCPALHFAWCLARSSDVLHALPPIADALHAAPLIADDLDAVPPIGDDLHAVLLPACRHSAQCGPGPMTRGPNFASGFNCT